LLLTTRDRVLEKLIVTQLVKFPAWYGTQRSLPCPQELITCPYPKPDASSHHFPHLVLLTLQVPGYCCKAIHTAQSKIIFIVFR